MFGVKNILNNVRRCKLGLPLLYKNNIISATSMQTLSNDNRYVKFQTLCYYQRIGHRPLEYERIDEYSRSSFPKYMILSFPKSLLNTYGYTIVENKRYFSKISSEINKKEKLKNALKEYGSTVIVFHISISLFSLGLFYMLLSGGFDIASFLEKLGFSSSVVSNKIAAEASTFLVAYAVHKLFAPVRISITLVTAPLIVKYLRKRGFLNIMYKK